MADLYEEIKEDVKQERFLRVWNRVKWYVIGGVCGVLIGTAGITTYTQWRDNENDALGGQLYQVTRGDETSSERWEPLLDVEHAAIRSLAQLRKAGFLLTNGQTEEAVLIYKEMALDINIPAEFRDFSRLILMYLQTNQEEEVPLPEQVWSSSVQEYRAVELLSNNQEEEARTKLVALWGDAQLPYGIRQKVKEMMDAIGGGIHFATENENE